MVKDEEIPEPTVPESFRVLMRELNSLGIDVIPHEALEVEDDEIKKEEVKVETPEAL